MRKRVLLNKIERTIYKLERRILKLNTKKFELQELAKKLELEIKEKENAVYSS